MGNSHSTDGPKSPNAAATAGRESNRKERSRDGSQYRNASTSSGSTQPASGARKPLSHVTTTTPHPQNPTATLLPSTANTQATTTTTTDPVTASHSRARSVTSSATPAARRDDSASSHQSSPMGNTESRHHRPPSRSSTLPLPPTPDQQQKSPSSQPVDVPAPSETQDGQNELDDNLMNSPMYAGPISNFNRPPRLPLPIDRDPEPTSPLATPTDATTPVDVGGGLTHRPSSVMSSTTLDDDDVGDIETFTEAAPYNQKVLTMLEWQGKGEHVYVTGTFANWEKKFKMVKHGDTMGAGLFTLTAQLPTGTHHIKFLVDGEMVLSNQYPTTVDYTNSLVNYVEIAAQLSSPEAQPPAPAEPMPIPGAPVSDTSNDKTAATPLDIRTEAHAPEQRDSLSSTLQETVQPPPRASQPPQSSTIPVQQPHQTQLLEHQHHQHPKPAPKKQLPRPKYTSQIPEHLLHIDLYNTPEDERYRRATKATSHLPQPPSLPMFMSKSILNAATPHKDDASVLTMPNHTVLNHLATSSIRQGVLATSGTTRYKRKFLTTIMYKPTSDAG